MRIKRRKIILLSGISVFLLAFLMVFFLYLLVMLEVFGTLPSKHVIKNITQSEATEIYSSDSVLLGRYFIKNRVSITTDKVPEHVVNALIATEDVRFFNHKGVDIRSLVRVLFKSILLRNESAGGGSTITQQLVKNTYPRKSYGILTIPVNKIREHILAIRFEKVYSKQEIISLYINTVSFGEDTYGLTTVSKRFFNKHPSTLTVEEAAILIGMLKSPALYNPRNHPDRAANRRNTVIAQMRKYGYLEGQFADSIQKLPITLNYQRFSDNSGFASYFRQFIEKKVVLLLKNKYPELEKSYDLRTDGLKIYTTLDAKLQSYAESSVSKHMKKLQQLFDEHWKGNSPWLHDQQLMDIAIRQTAFFKNQVENGLEPTKIFEQLNDTITTRLYTKTELHTITRMDSIKYYLSLLHAGFLAVDPSNGQTKAWVGGIDYKYFQYDHVLSKRPAGSTFKPILYCTALEKGYKPCDFFSNDSITFTEYDNWQPYNADRKFGGYYSLKGALKNSVNTVAARLIEKTGIESVIAMAEKLGIEHKFDKVPSLSLGSGNVSLHEMVYAYTAFLNEGKHVLPVYILRIEDKTGEILYQHPSTKWESPAMSPKTAETMTLMLQEVVKGGTAMDLRTKFGLTNEIGGKTGTTQNQSDGWFIAVTPDLVAGSWVGGSLPDIRFRDLSLGQGSKTALPIVGGFLSDIYNDKHFSNWPLHHFTYHSIDESSDLLNCPDYLEEMPRKWFMPEYNVIEDPDTTKTKVIDKFFKGLKRLFEKN